MNDQLRFILDQPPRGKAWELVARGPTATDWFNGDVLLYELVDASGAGSQGGSTPGQSPNPDELITTAPS